MKYVKSRLCQLDGLSCMGCCGNEIKDKLAVAKGIEKNTLEFKGVTEGCDKKEWMNREKGVHASGICRNLVYDPRGDKIYCPLHPELNNGDDIRLEHPECDILHVCKTAFLFDLWDNDTQRNFLNFVARKKRKGMCWHEFSKKMNSGELLEEFEGMKWD